MGKMKSRRTTSKRKKPSEHTSSITDTVLNPDFISDKNVNITNLFPSQQVPALNLNPSQITREPALYATQARSLLPATEELVAPRREERLPTSLNFPRTHIAQ